MEIPTSYVSYALCFLSGSLISVLVCYICSLRQLRLDEDVIKHVRSKAYRDGWQEGRNATFANPLSVTPEG